MVTTAGGITTPGSEEVWWGGGYRNLREYLYL